MDAVDNGYLCLAAAVIEQACDDYRVAYIVNDERGIARLEKFFRSKYFSTISNLNPEFLIKNLRDKYEAKRKERMKQKWEKKHEEETVPGCIV